MTSTLQSTNASSGAIDWSAIEKHLSHDCRSYFKDLSSNIEQARVIEIGVAMHDVAKRTNLHNAAERAMRDLPAKLWDKAWPQVRGEITQLRDDIGEQRSAIQNGIVEFRAERERLIGAKEALSKAPQGGNDFQACLLDKLRELLRSDCSVEDVSSLTGLINRCKTGDITATFTDGSIYAGHSIVFEAKNQQGVTLTAALKEIERAKLNRGASKGVFVFSVDKAPPEMERSFLLRDGHAFVKWSPDIPDTDNLLTAAFIVVNAGIMGPVAERQDVKFDVEELERELASGVSSIEGLDGVLSALQTITNAVAKARKEVNKSMTHLQHVFESFERNLISVIRSKNMK